jgi:hypothetical protein
MKILGSQGYLSMTELKEMVFQSCALPSVPEHLLKVFLNISLYYFIL